ncbi:MULTISPECIES: hypothetical protein [unclassified Breznakia]|uniref:hypothetical protein n=1 Tax=unclassified Breznakia TaxID=2623764 RepID=UPI002475B19D|nr:MULTISPECIES: hypothetical protein [unclassified Breznakia]MDH6367866.1 DNA-directed RNA polymerase specialized sigma24 family protein [Breznakia sp. PH1-1]MDH6404954.1 DNA-directed RNA polymerase specialized sigma24 family protein [Breznakia sp. PF1-11]MDH6412669.1 DNA-directed RNA polymerase specialized sigma24 family protein [Breznakia sp. PFB1-11]MDH6415028.1 DNA-directed RNA polymerase specialized sigma24 family protein [Breznakia sp. PFB1-14]MDH6417340.1 DNA-directed RNA polymerase sp
MNNYLDKVDREETIKLAKIKLERFQELYNLIGNEISISSIKYDEPYINSSITNADANLVRRIVNKDERLKEVNEVLCAIEKLDPIESELLFNKYILGKNSDEMQRLLSLSKAKLYRHIKSAYYHFALILKIEVIKS